LKRPKAWSKYKIALTLPEGELTTITPWRPNLGKTVFTVQIQTNGTARITREQIVHGTAFGGRHRYFAELTPEKRNREFQEMVASIAQAAQPVGDLKTDFSAYPGIISFTVDVPDYAVTDGTYMYFQTPASLNNAIRLGADTRENPLYMPAHRRSSLVIHMEVPGDYAIRYMPAAIDEPDVEGQPLRILWEFAAATNNAMLQIAAEGEIATDPAIIPADDYEALLDLQQHLAHKRACTILLDTSF